MVQRKSSFALTAARIGSVAGALAVLAYFVVDAQNAANARTAVTSAATSAASVAAGVGAEPAVDAAAGAQVIGSPVIANEVFPPLPGSSYTDPVLVPQGESPAFLYGSKSMVISDQPWGTPRPPGAATLPADPAVVPATPEEPVFLPSSKSHTVTSILRPALLPASTPAPAEPVFLPSSKVETIPSVLPRPAPSAKQTVSSGSPAKQE